LLAKPGLVGIVIRTVDKIEIQSETALRHVATKYPYDIFEDEGYSDYVASGIDWTAAETCQRIESFNTGICHGLFDCAHILA
jgi:hypothetical protein